MNEFEIQCSSIEQNKRKGSKYQGDVTERMKGPRGTELATPFHPLYTPWGLSPGGTDQNMEHWEEFITLLSHVWNDTQVQFGFMWMWPEIPVSRVLERRVQFP